MQEQFDIHDYLAHLGRRWRFIAIACGSAVVLTLAISLILPRQYTATATILIDPPSGTDPRIAAAVSPIYLESLKTYEQFASSDTLFLKAVDRFHLRDSASTPVDTLKRRVLKVQKPRDTKVLQISVTLGDPAKAHELAQFLAEQTVGLNQKLSRQSDQDILDEAQRQLNAARTRLQQAEKAAADESASEPLEGLQGDIDNLVELRVRLRRELLDAKVDLADYTAQGAQRDLAAVRARAGVLEQQLAALNDELARKEKELSRRRSRWDALNAELSNARTARQTAETHFNETRWGVGARSERLRIIDPGIVPQRPSFPNIPLNGVGAAFIGLVAAWLYVTIGFNLRKQVRPRPVRAYSVER